MTSRRLLLLAVLAVLVTAGALLLSRQPTTTSSDQSQLLYPELKNNLNTVDAIEVFKAGEAAVVAVKRKGEDWVVANRGDYPADAAKIRKFLITAAEAKLVEEKTSNPANYAAIGVEDITVATATGHRVVIGGASQPLQLIAGKEAAGARSQYVRRVGDKQSWLISNNLDLPTTPDSWLKKDIIDIAPANVQSVTVAIAGAKPYTAAKQTREQADFSIDGLPKGKALSSPSAANSAGSALTVLTLTDVRKAQEVTGTPAAHATFRTFDGLVVELDGWAQDNKHYVTLATNHDSALAARFKVAPPEKPADSAAKPAAATQKTEPPASVDVAAQATKQNAQLAGWAYEIPDYKYQAIFKPLDELLKP